MGEKRRTPTSSALRDHTHRAAFTLIELLTVLAIISLLLSILLPTLAKVKSTARKLINTANQGNIALGAIAFSNSNNDCFPPSIPALLTASGYSCQAPDMLVSLYRLRTADISVSAQLSPYIPSAKTFQCPNAPARHIHHEDMYDSGNAYNNPDTRSPSDPFHGSYALWWNYKGYLAPRQIYTGPSRNTARPNAMLTSDTLFTDHYLIPNSYLTGCSPDSCEPPQVRYASCERLPRASRSSGNFWQTPFWYTRNPTTLPNVNLQASFVDGSTQTFNSSNTTTLRVLIDPVHSVPYPTTAGMPSFQIPTSASTAKSH